MLRSVTAANAQYLAKEGACFNAANFTTFYSFEAPKSGNLHIVELHHVSGYITRNTATDPFGSNFGTSSSYLEVQLLREYPMTGTEETLLPNYDTEGVTSIAESGAWCGSGHGCSVWYYFMDDYAANSDILRWNTSQNPVAVSVNDTMSLQSGEGCCDMDASNNAGVSCADVYFEYEPFGLVSVSVLLFA